MRSAMIAVMLVAGCAPMAEPSETQPAVAACNARAATVLVGRVYDEALLAEAKRLSGAEILRVIRPGDMTTKDYRENRLNLNLDNKGAVVSTNCG